MKITAFVDPADALIALGGAAGWSLAALSRAIGRSPRYLDRFIREKVPVELPPEERASLAWLLDTDERNLMPAGGVGVYEGFYSPAVSADRRTQVR